MKSVVTVVVVLAGALGALRAEDWPQWRGPHRTGAADGTGMPDAWPAQPPAPRWRVPVGEGYSGAAVHQGRVYVLGREADGQETCLCLDAGTGARLWRYAYPAPYTPPDLSAGRGPKATPTVDRDRVYFFGLGGMLTCLDLRTGAVLWRHDCLAEYWGVEKDAQGEDAWFPPVGNAASPLVDGDRVLLPLGGKKAGSVTAFDRRTGAVVWKALEERGSYGSLMAADLAGTRQVVGFTGRRMVGVSAADGRLLWDYPFPAQFEQTMLTPVIWKDLVIFGGERKPTVALRIKKDGDGARQSVAWTSEDFRSTLSTGVVAGDHLFGLDSRLARLVCLDLATGQMVWGGGKVSGYASLVVADGKLLALDTEGRLFVAEANQRQYVPLAEWRVSEAGGTWGHLAVANGRLYVKDKEHLLCIDVAGRQR